MVRKNLRRANKKAAPVSEWERWFAWYPVKLLYEINESPGKSYQDSGNRVWMAWVERRWVPAYAHDKGYWEHRKIGAV